MAIGSIQSSEKPNFSKSEDSSWFPSRLTSRLVGLLNFWKPSSSYREVFCQAGGQREEFRDFLRNIFMQLDDQKFYPLIDSILKNEHLSDQEIYEELCSRIGEANFGKVGTPLAALKSLKVLKKELSEQIDQVMGTQKKVDGYVEIGYPGRMVRPLRGKLEMSGPTIVVNDQESLGDYMQSGFPRPYQKFVSLNDYSPIPESQIPNASVDLVTCFIGLHHIPPEKVEAFVQSIQRVLRPGGSFVLMDHDAGSPAMQKLVSTVHSVFNAANRCNPCRRAKRSAQFSVAAALDGYRGRAWTQKICRKAPGSTR